MRHKVVAYITWGDKLLVFRHTQFPEAGIQVPAGTVEPGETPHQAVLREAREESGLTGLQVVRFLGLVDVDRAQWGAVGVERRYFYHLRFRGQAPARWLHHEKSPSDGSPGPIEFEMSWVRMPDQVPPLAGEQGALLSLLLDSLGR